MPLCKATKMLQKRRKKTTQILSSLFLTMIIFFTNFFYSKFWVRKKWTKTSFWENNFGLPKILGLEQKNYETYNNERKELVFSSSSKFQIKRL